MPDGPDAPASVSAAGGAVVATPSPVHAGGTDSAPIEAARPRPAVAADPPLNPVSVTEPAVPATAFGTAAPTAATLAAPFAPVEPVINIRMSMLMGIIAIRSGMVSELRLDSDDVGVPLDVSATGVARA